MIKYTSTILISFLFLSSCLMAESLNITVSPDGPISTLKAAQSKVRELKKQQPGKPIEVLIKGGIYELRETVVFGLEDSGTLSAPITYKAYPGETPVFTGGIKIDNWKKVESDPEGVAEAAKGNLWVADIPAVNANGREWYIKTLYDEETLLKRASARLGRRKPDQERPFDYNTHGRGIYEGEHRLEFEGPLVEPFERHIDFRDNDLRDWENMQDIELALTDRPWLRNIISLERVDVENKVAYLSLDPTYQPNNHRRGYEVENAIDYLDEPGEWVVNTLKGKIYMWPEKDLSEMNVMAPLIHEFIRVEGREKGPFAQHIHFEGLTFMHGARDILVEGDKGLQHDWEMYDKGNAVVRFRYAEDCKFNSNVIKSSSGTGIRLDMHCQKIEIASNHLKYLGGNGVVLSGYAPGTVDVNKNNIVHDNYIHHIGEILWHSAGIFITQSGNNEITHNTIRELPYNGIVVSGCRPHEFYHINRLPFRRAWMNSIRVEEAMPYIKKGLASDRPISIDHFLPILHARENRIIMNDISRVLLKLHDGNAVYFSAMGENNVVDQNYLHKNWGTAGTVRLDDNPSFTIITNNVIAEADHGLSLKGPADVFNNFIFTDTFLRGRAMPGWLGATKQAYPKMNIFMPPASSKSSNGLYLTSKRAKDRPFFLNLPKTENSIYYTLNISKSYVPTSALGTDLVTGEPVTPGTDEIKLLYADPMFDQELMKQGFFRFQKGSVAERMGIQPLDMRKVGSSLAEKDFSGFDVSALIVQPPVSFIFKNGSPFDDVLAETQMVVDGITMTSVEIVNLDGTTKGGKTSIHAPLNALGIRSPSGGDSGKYFDAGEAWIFEYDKDITSVEIAVSGLDSYEGVFNLSFEEGAEIFSINFSSDDLKHGVYSLNRTIPASTPIQLKLIEGKEVLLQSISVAPSDK